MDWGWKWTAEREREQKCTYLFIYSMYIMYLFKSMYYFFVNIPWYVNFLSKQTYYVKWNFKTTNRPSYSNHYFCLAIYMYKFDQLCFSICCYVFSVFDSYQYTYIVTDWYIYIYCLDHLPFYYYHYDCPVRIKCRRGQKVIWISYYVCSNV